MVMAGPSPIPRCFIPQQEVADKSQSKTIQYTPCSGFDPTNENLPLSVSGMVRSTAPPPPSRFNRADLLRDLAAQFDLTACGAGCVGLEEQRARHTELDYFHGTGFE